MAPCGVLLRWLAIFSVPWALAVDCDADGLALTNEVNDYRASEGLPPLVVSPSLIGLAVIKSNHPGNKLQGSKCNLHSWGPDSQSPKRWTACCYDGSSNLDCMWDKIRTLTSIDATGFEISASGYSSNAKAIKGWDGSSGHRKVMKTKGSWAGLKAMGCGKVDRTYNCWFMNLASDPLGECTGASPSTTLASQGSEGTTQPATSSTTLASEGSQGTPQPVTSQVKGVGLEGIVVAMLSIAALQ